MKSKANGLPPGNLYEFEIPHKSRAILFSDIDYEIDNVSLRFSMDKAPKHIGGNLGFCLMDNGNQLPFYLVNHSGGIVVQLEYLIDGSWEMVNLSKTKMIGLNLELVFMNKDIKMHSNGIKVSKLIKIYQN